MPNDDRNRKSSNRVVIHEKGDGLPPSVYSDGDVEVIWVCDPTPEDRFYRMTPTPTPDDLSAEIAKGHIGEHGDDPQKHARAHAAHAKMSGKPRLVLVEKPSPTRPGNVRCMDCRCHGFGCPGMPPGAEAKMTIEGTSDD